MRVKRLICICMLSIIFILSGCGKDYTDTNIPLDPLTPEPITSNISNESIPQPDNTEPLPPTDKSEPLILVTTNVETIAEDTTAGETIAEETPTGETTAPSEPITSDPITSDPITSDPITSTNPDESNPQPDNTEPPSSTEKWEPLILVTTNGETTAPFNHWLWSSQSWETHGWLSADGYPLYMKLPEYADELPAITYSNDFAVQYKENVSFYGLSIFNDSFERLLYRGKISSLDDLSEGTYYISIQVIVLGKYIEKEDEYESQGYECVFKMMVKQ